jgi:hypothetical protein
VFSQTYARFTPLFSGGFVAEKLLTDNYSINPHDGIRPSSSYGWLVRFTHFRILIRCTMLFTTKNKA